LGVPLLELSNDPLARTAPLGSAPTEWRIIIAVDCWPRHWVAALAFVQTVRQFVGGRGPMGFSSLNCLFHNDAFLQPRFAFLCVVVFLSRFFTSEYSAVICASSHGPLVSVAATLCLPRFFALPHWFSVLGPIHILLSLSLPVSILTFIESWPPCRRAFSYWWCFLSATVLNRPDALAGLGHLSFFSQHPGLV